MHEERRFNFSIFRCNPEQRAGTVVSLSRGQFSSAPVGTVFLRLTVVLGQGILIGFTSREGQVKSSLLTWYDPDDNEVGASKPGIGTPHPQCLKTIASCPSHSRKGRTIA